MNYYPYYNMLPNASIATTASRGILRGLIGRGFNWSSILTNTQKTLGLINQTIPVIKQVSPVMKNAKTMFRVMNEFKKVDTPSTETTLNNHTNESLINKSITQNDTINKINYDSGPTFFINQN